MFPMSVPRVRLPQVDIILTWWASEVW